MKPPLRWKHQRHPASVTITRSYWAKQAEIQFTSSPSGAIKQHYSSRMALRSLEPTERGYGNTMGESAAHSSIETNVIVASMHTKPASVVGYNCVPLYLSCRTVAVKHFLILDLLTMNGSYSAWRNNNILFYNTHAHTHAQSRLGRETPAAPTPPLLLGQLPWQQQPCWHNLWGGVCGVPAWPPISTKSLSHTKIKDLAHTSHQHFG